MWPGVIGQVLGGVEDAISNGVRELANLTCCRGRELDLVAHEAGWARNWAIETRSPSSASLASR